MNNKEGNTDRKEFLHNLIIGVILFVLIIPFSVVVSDKMIVGYGADNDTIVSRMILVFGTLILVIYSMMVLLVKLIIHFMKSDSERALVESTQQVTGNWYKWLIAAFLIFVIVMLFLKIR